MKSETSRALTAAMEAGFDYVEKIDDRRVAPDAAALEGLRALQVPLGNNPVDAADVVRSLHTYGSAATVGSSGGLFLDSSSGRRCRPPSRRVY